PAACGTALPAANPVKLLPIGREEVSKDTSSHTRRLSTWPALSQQHRTPSGGGRRTVPAPVVLLVFPAFQPGRTRRLLQVTLQLRLILSQHTVRRNGNADHSGIRRDVVHNFIQCGLHHCPEAPG